MVGSIAFSRAGRYHFPSRDAGFGALCYPFGGWLVIFLRGGATPEFARDGASGVAGSDVF